MIIIENRFRNWVGILASIFLGMIFLLAGISKFYAPVKELELLTIFEYIPFYPTEVLIVWLMFVELMVGIFLIVGIFVKLATCFSLFLIFCFIASNILMITLGLDDCLSCFGELGELSAEQALYFDGIMVALAVTILFLYPGRFSSVRPWYWGK